MARRVTDPPTRHSIEDWHRSNEHQYQTSELERMKAERARAEHERLRQETHERKEKTQSDVAQTLGQRVNDVSYWRDEVVRRHSDVQDHINAACHMLARLQSALRDTELPLETTKRCLANRERRRGIDLVHDNVQTELLKEQDTLMGVAGALTKAISQVTEQIRLLRKNAYNLSKDIQDKNTAEYIDRDCHQRNEGTVGGYQLPKQAIVDSKSVAPGEWEGFSDANMMAAERACHTYDKINAINHDLLNQSQSDITMCRRDTNTSFERRIEETQDTKNRLEDHLQKVIEETESIGNDIHSLTQAIQEKIPALQLSQFRTTKRSERPNIELVRDPVHYRLIAEAVELDASIRQLQSAYTKAVQHYEALCSRNVALTEDIETKAISLHIDLTECMGIRQQLPDLWTGQ